MYLKNISDCVPSRDESIGTHLHPPLFWLDNILKANMRNHWDMNRFFFYLEFLLLGVHFPAAGKAPQHVQDGSVRLGKKLYHDF